jgi:hypothetical protein
LPALRLDPGNLGCFVRLARAVRRMLTLRLARDERHLTDDELAQKRESEYQLALAEAKAQQQHGYSFRDITADAYGFGQQRGSAWDDITGQDPAWRPRGDL